MARVNSAAEGEDQRAVVRLWAVRAGGVGNDDSIILPQLPEDEAQEWLRSAAAMAKLTVRNEAAKRPGR